ncbi:MAG TPA: hypothetical protein PKL81_03655 [Ferruginibacter sp.]|jgi:hypothetical protein|nr:hypothetical protein [Ferruginibacter sp.]HNF02773.1 hypothetical protein [Ferruginibacter sp.]HNH20630.1 hypothetical protein [Ferruginibacter sp.]HNJ27933.1 hypothetical protein [Ferruginibacter sp.]HNJ94397.1 hypothetical protein [Ferruginibacter sp.]
MRINLLLFILLFLSVSARAAVDTVKVPLQRQLFHDRINEEQLQLDKIDGKADGQIRATHAVDINQIIADVMLRKVNDLQDKVELNEKLISNNQKIRYLSYIESLVRGYRHGVRNKELNPAYAPMLLENFEKIMQANIDSQSMAPFIQEVPYALGRINAEIFSENKGYADSKKILYQKFCVIHPDKILQTIEPYINEPFADSLIVISCKFNPTSIYSVAQAAESKLGMLVHRNKNPLVVAVVELSKTPNALFYFPFLDDLLKGRKTVESIKKYVGDGETGYDSVGYFKLLVQTEIEYFKRMVSPAKDTPIALFGPNGLREVLRTKAIQHFVTPINTLHDLSNINQRMRSIDSLSAVDIYFMMVMSESEIYTSSYKHSFFRMLQRLGAEPRTDSLLLSVHFDFFKKFIKMAANYNKLDTFLKFMPKQSSETLMRGFIANLDNTGNLEDAVDVADSYSSINDPVLQSTILGYVIENEKKALQNNNSRGKTIYSLLKSIFLSADSTNKIDLTSVLGIPSIYEIENKDIRDDSGRIVQQVYWYGDDDGKKFFPAFISSFSPKEWIISPGKEWYEIRSRKGNVWVFANRPLDNDANLDDSAQVHLNNYLAENNMLPSVVVHRGHSYWLPRTIKRMAGNARIVVLGSCGGYKNLNDIIDVNPDAHIISTKEIGTGDINRPILNYLNQTFESGNKLVWKTMWASLTRLFANDPSRAVRESWEDYIPPYKNLGAIFLKGYNNMIQEE